MRSFSVCWLPACVLLCLSLVPGLCSANVLHSISYVTEHPLYNIVLVQTKSEIVSYRFGRLPGTGRTVYVELRGVTPGDQTREIDVNGGAVRRIRVSGNRSRRLTRVLIDLQPGVRAQEVVHRKLSGGLGTRHGGQVILLIDLPRGRTRTVPSEEEARRLREEGKRIVIIDPGHGWLDSGCVGHGMEEKTVCLDIGRKLATLINQTDNMRAYLTREGDYLPVMDKGDYSGTWKQIKSKSLSARLEFARRMHGHVFVSLHLNWARRAGARGFEIYYLGPENSQSLYQDQVDEIDPADLLAFDVELPESGLDVETSRFLLAMKRDITTQYNDLFVENLKNNLLRVPSLVPRDPPIKPHGRLRVLRTLAMPSALVEMAFLSNSRDAALLKSTESRWRLAQALYRGIAEFFEQLSNGVLYAQSFRATPVTVPDEDYEIHVVRSGETLFSIARRYGTDVSTLQRINGKGRGTAIYPGEEIKVPRHVWTSTAQTYQVRKGDTLWEIARRHGISVNELRYANGLKSDNLVPGQKLIVPSRTYAQASSPASRRSVKRIGIYKVRRGDSLYTIARRYRTSVAQIKSLNRLKSTRIHPGDKLRVPLR